MASSPLHSKSVSSGSVCGAVVKVGSVVTVPKDRVDSRACRLANSGRIEIRASNRSGFVQIKCVR